MIEARLEQSRVLMLCMSANAFGSDWAQLEAGTFRFRENRESRNHCPTPAGAVKSIWFMKWQERTLSDPQILAKTLTC